MKLPTLNPVLARELRQRMRGPRASIVITLYLLLLTLIVWTLYAGATASQENSFSGPSAEEVAGLGRSVFQTLLFFVLLLVCFIVPGSAAGGIAGERERQTLVPLQVTLLRPRSVILGKLVASLAFTALLVIATLPLVGIAFVLGGVEPGEVLKGTAMVLVVAAVLSCTSLLCSTITRRTQGATVLSYGIVLSLLIGTFFVFGAQAVFLREEGVRHQWVLHLNPLMAVADVLDSEADIFSGGSTVSPFTPMQMLLRVRQEETFESSVRQEITTTVDENGVVTEEFSSDDVANDIDREDKVPLLNRVPFVVYSLIAYALMSAGSVAWASYRIAVPKAAP